jgi:ABC-type nickel/cobalt efflux system permease component RcnA
MTTILVLGFLVGLQHAMEADHLAAVASLATRSRSVVESARQGAVWGLGHTITLFLFGGAVLIADSFVPERLATALEFAVGVMLVLLGADVLRRVVRERVHFHAHRHGDTKHFHAHAHTKGADHASDPHEHRHPERQSWRPLLVGMMHGMAGSAALIVLALGAVQNPWQGLAYIAVFGIGSVAGMVIVGAAIGLPLRYSPRGLTWVHNGLRTAVGLFTVGLGGYVLFDTGIAGGLFA